MSKKYTLCVFEMYIERILKRATKTKQKAKREKEKKKKVTSSKNKI